MSDKTSIQLDKETSKKVSIVAALLGKKKEEITKAALDIYLADYLKNIEKLRFK